MWRKKQIQLNTDRLDNLQTTTCSSFQKQMHLVFDDILLSGMEESDTCFYFVRVMLRVVALFCDKREVQHPVQEVP